MQIIYAAPFIFLSILSFAICLGVPRFRRFAFSALVVPVTFGVCSITGWILFVLSAVFVFHLNLGPATGLKGITWGILFYVFPGVLGAWIGVSLVRISERYFRKSAVIRHWAIRSIIALIAAFIGGVLSLGFAADLLPPGSMVASLLIASVASIAAGAIGFTITALVQRHYAANFVA